MRKSVFGVWETWKRCTSFCVWVGGGLELSIMLGRGAGHLDSCRLGLSGKIGDGRGETATMDALGRGHGGKL